MTASSATPSRATAERRRAVFGWALAVSVYLLAVLHRTSLGVAGLLAERRFGITAAQLSVFIFLQLGVYAALQIPTGVLVDRYGPRRLLVVASLVMGAAQLLFAAVPSYPVALLARFLLGAGDALTFVSVLRFAALRFGPRRYPLIVSLTGMTGMIGNVLATLPLALVLRHAGWTTGFGVAALVSLVAAVAVFALLPDNTPAARPVRGVGDFRAGVGSVWTRVRGAWALPGTRLGFWVHFACMSTTTAFGVLWGSPYLVKAAGLSTAGAGTVLMCGVIGAGAASPALGWLIGHRPVVRVPIALSVCLLTIAGWLVLVLAYADHPPTGYVVALFVFMALGGPASMTAFALARDYNHARTLGTASGVVNVGGFLATVLIALGIGWAVDAQGATTAGTLRWAVLVAVAVQAFGTVQLTIWYLRVRSFALTRQQVGEPVPVPVVRRRWDLSG
ncbi:MAG: nitrate/nitrite transporter [Jatrophihabitans sp.]|uniref:MFS transporter n=1 Tax=Jatrophihabitans sp. TaxID=1932789 RepID=UPI0039133841